ncbi:MAG: hypothetical protein WCD37_08885 [Chloroflexia bacterium]
MYLKNISSGAKAFALLLAVVAGLAIAAGASASPLAGKSSASGASPDVNQTVNGTFESGSMVPWDTSFSGGVSTISTTTVHSGLYSLQIAIGSNGTNGSGVAGGGSCPSGERVPTTAGTTYTLAGWINVPVGTSFTSAFMEIAWYSSCASGGLVSTNRSSLVTTATGVWQFITMSVAAPAGSTHAELRLLGRASPAPFVYFDDVTFGDGTLPGHVQWTHTLPTPGLYAAAPAIGFSSTGESLIFVGGNSGSHVGLRATATATPSVMWSNAVGSAIQNRASVLTIGSTKVVYFTSQNGCVNAFNAVTGAAFWNSPSGCVRVGTNVLAGVGYQPGGQSGGPTNALIFAATSANTLTNTVVALDAATGAPVWYFGTAPFTGMVGTAAALGPVTTKPAVGWAPKNGVYFGSTNSSGSGGGVWAISTTAGSNGALLWSQAPATVGTVSNSQPSLSSDLATLYVGTDDLAGGGRTLRAMNTTNGSTRASRALASGSNFIGVPWPNGVTGGTNVYFTYGNRVYAVSDTGGATLPFKSGFGAGTNGYTNMPGGGSPLVLGDGLFIGGNDGAFYKMDTATGVAVGRLFLNAVALVSDATYDGVRGAFYIVYSGRLHSIQGSWTGTGLGPSLPGEAPAVGSKPSAPGDQPVAGGESKGEAPSARARLTSLGLYAPQQAPTPKKIFSASIDNWMYVRMGWSGVTGLHEAHVTFYDPNGSLYQTLNVLFTTTNDGPQTIQRPGVLNPETVQVAPPNPGTVVWAEMPVAGTWMTRMPGRWTVEIKLDNDQQVHGWTDFTLVP